MNLAADVDICRQGGTADFPNLVHGTPQLADRDLDLLHGTGAGVQQTETVGLVRVNSLRWWTASPPPPAHSDRGGS